MLTKPEGTNRNCGPTALAAVTGLSTDQCAGILRLETDRPLAKGITVQELVHALARAGMTPTFEWERSKPIFRDWLKNRTLEQRRRTGIVVVSGHFVAVENGKVMDTLNGMRIIPTAESASLDNVVQMVVWVSGQASMPREMVDPEEARRVHINEATVYKRKARALAKQLGISVDRPDRSHIHLVFKRPTVVQRLELSESSVTIAGDWKAAYNRLQQYAERLAA